MPTLKIVSINRIDLQKSSAKHVILIPIRSFSDSKSRLAAVLSPSERADLIAFCSKRVLSAAGELPKIVISSDPTVRDFAQNLGCEVIRDNGEGLSSAVQHAYELVAGRGAKHVTVAHADLPLAEDLTTLIREGAVTIVPDRNHDGTNVISLPTESGFRFAYGPNSFERHLREAARLNLGISINENPQLTMDIDTPEDLLRLFGESDFDLEARGVDTRLDLPDSI